MAVDSHLTPDPPFLKEAWFLMQEWYKESTNRALPPTYITISRMKVERVAMYTRVPLPPGDNFPVWIETLPVDNSVPHKD